MPKGYWVVTYRDAGDPAKLAAYRALAPGAITRAGGRFLARKNAASAHEAGLKERIVLIEFDSLEAATAAYETPDYKKALAAFDNGAIRDFRIVEGG